MAHELATRGDAVVQRLSVVWLPSAQLVDDRGAIEQNVLAADQAFRNSNARWKLIRRPSPARPGSEPMTVSVISCSRIIASFVVQRGRTSSTQVPRPDLPRATLGVLGSDQGCEGTSIWL